MLFSVSHPQLGRSAIGVMTGDAGFVFWCYCREVNILCAVGCARRRWFVLSNIFLSFDHDVVRMHCDRDGHSFGR
jgi:hypothetical protein